ncbi:MAG: cell division protein FtsQ [Gracilibacter sp. BRH_c7a]|nr:MAG: cell division protein FtsQ [Gracilibacter sp. BRH_c7a]
MANSLTQTQVNQSKTLMLFILAMSLSGLENLVAEIIPEFQIGPIELGISSFIFIPLVLVILFDNIWVALAAPIGEIVFADLILGEFGGLGEFEEVILLTMGLYLAGRLVKDVASRKQLIIAALVGFGFTELAGTMIDIGKVWIGIEQLEAVPGLPESIVALEGIDFLVEFVITGIIFGVLPTLYFVPRLYGKLEPMLGIKPREIDDSRNPLPIAVTIGAVIAVILGTTVAFISEMGINIIEWEADFLDKFGDNFIWVPIGIAALVAVITFILAKNGKTKEAKASQEG